MINMSVLVKLVIYFVGYLISIFAGSYIIKRFLKFTKINTEKFDKIGLLNAGKYIGFLERFIITTFVLLDEYSAISFVLLAKSIFRLNEIKNNEDRELVEYIIIGNLLSFSIALFIGLSIKCAIKNL